jgi:C4-dicarboxylate-specific signal transduction histidine kinase
MNFISANHKFIEALNIKQESMIKGKAFSDYLQSIALISLVERFIKSDDLTLFINHDLLIERKIHHFRFTIEKLFTPSVIIVIYAEDQTELFLNSQELEALKISSMQASRMAVLGEMAAGIAHEINNPLAVISTLADQTLRSLVTDSIEIEILINKITKIKKTTERIHKIVRGLKSHAREGQSDPFESNLVQNLINDSLILCVDTLKSHNINLIVDEIDPCLELECRGSQISQVILNLISNAKDAIKDKEEDRWIKIGAIDIGESIQFTLTDCGNGISKEIQQKILEPFFTTKPVGEGTG